MNDQLHQWRGLPATLPRRDREPTTAERISRSAHDRRLAIKRRSIRRVGVRLAVLVVIALLCTLSDTAPVFDSQTNGLPEPQTGLFLSLEHGITPFIMK